MGTILQKELKLFIKRKANFFWLLGLPILFIVIMSAAFGRDKVDLTIYTVDQDQSSISKAFVKQLDHISGIKIQKETNLNSEISQLKKGNISAILVIPKGYGQLANSHQQAKLQLYRDGATNQEAEAVQTLLTNVSNQYRNVKLQTILSMMGQSKDQVAKSMQSPVTIQTIKENSTKINAITQVVPGYMVMFVFFIIISMVTRFAKERESGMVSRLKSTSLRSWQYLIGMWLPNVFVVLLQCLILLGFGHYAYGLALGNVSVIALIVLCLSICGTGIGLAVALLVETETAGRAITQLFTLGGAMLGGLWVPFDMLPSIVQKIGKFTPQYWAQHGMQEVIARGAGFMDVWPTFVALLAFGIVSLLVAIIRYPRFLQRAVN